MKTESIGVDGSNEMVKAELFVCDCGPASPPFLAAETLKVMKPHDASLMDKSKYLKVPCIINRRPQKACIFATPK